jgi:multiple sugar transport system permease protein
LSTLSDIKPLPSAVNDSMKQEMQEDAFFKRVFLSPAVILLLIMSIFPLIWSLSMSFTTCQRNAAEAAAQRQNEASGTAAPTLGSLLCLGTPADLSLRNYERIWNTARFQLSQFLPFIQAPAEETYDPRLWGTVRNTLLYVVFGVGFQYGIGLALAALLNQEFVGRRFFRAIFLLPMMITPVAAGYLGRMMFDSSLSPLAQLLRTFFGSTFRIGWLTEADIAPITMVLIDSWQWIPFMTLLLLAGMQAIPDEVYEAARVDGATNWQQFLRITFPILLPISLTAILIRGLEIFKFVDIIRVTTGGGPGTATESIVMYVFEIAVNFGNFGYAAAISYVLLVMVIAFSTGFLALSRRLQAQQLGT